MNEIKSIQLQIERQVLSLSFRIENIYSSLRELNQLTNIFFSMTVNDKEEISNWLENEEFITDDDYFISQKELKNFMNKTLSDEALTYQWPKVLKDDIELKQYFYALRNIGKVLKDIKEKLGDISIIYYQDIINNACLAYPYFEMKGVIPADFNWNEYYTCKSVNPKNNPNQEIRWSPANIDYAGEGLISIASIPIYKEKKFIGLWSIDVPFQFLHQECIVDTLVPNQINFITDFEGNIISHPLIKTKIDKEKGSFYQVKINELENIYSELNINEIKKLNKGKLEFTDDKGEIQILLFQIIPRINWIMFALFPKSIMFESVKDNIVNTFNTMINQKSENKVDTQNDNIQILIDSYNDMISVLAYNQSEKEKAQQKALAVQKQLNGNLGILVRQRTKELEEKNQELHKLSITDNLTKLFNRNKLDEVLLQESNRANRFNHTFGVIIIDIDYFKSTNDKHGHLIGDMILKEFSDIIKTNSRKTDIVGRWGGEEFLIICAETNSDGIFTFAKHLREDIEKFSFSLNEQKTASFGVSIYKKNEDIKALIKRADDALYKAKENGRNRVEYL